MMKQKNAGFTMIEMLIVICIIGFVLAATSNTFVTLLRAYKQQTKIAETNIEGIIGLELLRRDIENAGFGLPWAIPSGVAYTEAGSAPASNYNEAPGNTPPRPILNGHDGWLSNGAVATTANSDYLVIKATNVSRNASAQLWTYSTTSVPLKTWNTGTTGQSQTPQNGDWVITLSPGSGNGDMRTLEDPGEQVPITPPNVSDLAQPKLVFDLHDSSLGAAPWRPFNRADYMIQGPGQANVPIPARCAPNAGVLVKKMLNLTNSSNSTEVLPLLDCVADMKVVFRLDTNGDGIIDAVTDNLTGLTALQIRQQLKEVRVYILAQEGQKDTNYTSPSPIYVGDLSIGGSHYYNIGTNTNYRWKLYYIVVQPKNVRQANGDTG